MRKVWGKKGMRFLVMLMLLSMATGALGSEILGIGDFFKVWLDRNPDYEILMLQIEISEMNYERAKIEASSIAEQLRAELDYTNRLSTQQRNLQQMYADGITSLTNMFTHEISLELAEIQFQEASKTVADNESLRNRNLISETDMKTSRLQLEEARQSLVSANWDYLKSKHALERVLDTVALTIDFTLPEPTQFFVSHERFTAQNLALKVSELNRSMSRNDLENLSYLASPFERKEKELNLKDRELSYQRLILSTREDHEERMNNLENLFSSAQIALTRWEIEQERFSDMVQRHQRGLVSEREYNNSRRSLRNAERTYYTSVRQYATALIQYLIEIGHTPEEVL